VAGVEEGLGVELETVALLPVAAPAAALALGSAWKVTVAVNEG